MEWIERVETLLRLSAPKIAAYRHDLHQIPEASFQEIKTTAYLENVLKNNSSLELIKPASTGLMAVLRGQKAGKGIVLGLRSDIDGIKQQEETGLPYASLHPGYMHACGHDGHMAILLGVIEVLTELTAEFAGEIRFLFQHAEELHPGGARDLVDKGVLEKMDYILATHLWSTLPAGTIGLRPGPFMAAPDNFRITVKGQGGHAAMPQKTLDPVTAAAHMIVAFQTLVARQIDPLQSCVLSVTKLASDAAYNIIPDQVHLSGTVRVFDEALRPWLKERMEDVVKGICGAFGLQYDIWFDNGYDVVDNHRELTAKLTNIFRRFLPGVTVEQIGPSMCGEDFSAYQKKIPGVMFFTGAGNTVKKAAYPQHHCRFDIDEDALLTGASALVWAALSLLGAVEAADLS